MKTIKNLLLCICISLSADLYGRAISLSLRNLSEGIITKGDYIARGGPIVDQAGNEQYARSYPLAIVPLNPGELKGWAWFNEGTFQSPHTLVTEDIFNLVVRFLYLKVNIAGNEVTYNPQIPPFINLDLDFAMLPGGKPIIIRSYRDGDWANVAMQHPNFKTLYEGAIQQSISPRIILDNGTMYYNNLIKAAPGKIVMDGSPRNVEIQGNLKEYIPGKVIFKDGTVLNSNGSIINKDGTMTIVDKNFQISTIQKNDPRYAILAEGRVLE